MAATPITPTRPTSAGVNTTAEVAVDIANGNTARNLPGLVLVFHNTDSVSRSVTLTTSGTVGGYAVADQVTSIPAGQTWFFANFSPTAFGDLVGFSADSVLVKVTAYQAS